MADSHNCVITMTHFNRPDYTKASLEALSKCRGIENCLLLPHVEPVCEEVIALVKAVDFCECRPTINPEKLRADPNTIRAFDEAFALSDFLIHVEDDILLAPDALDYFWWARAHYHDDQDVCVITAYNREREEPHWSKYGDTHTRAWFHPWGCGLWRGRWQRMRNFILGVTGTTPQLTWTNKGTKGWDNGIQAFMEQREPKLREAYPRLSRSQNIGVSSSIHSPRTFTPEWHRENQHVPHWSGDGRVTDGVEWRKAD